MDWAPGVYGTLIGAGGGFILMPALLFLFPDRPPEELTAISLAVVFFNALSGSGQYAIMKRIDYKPGLIFAAATIPGAVTGALNTAVVARPLFNVILGALLLAGAIFLLVQPTIKEESKSPTPHPGRFTMNRHLVEARGSGAHTFSVFCRLKKLAALLREWTKRKESLFAARHGEPDGNNRKHPSFRQEEVKKIKHKRLGKVLFAKHLSMMLMIIGIRKKQLVMNKYLNHRCGVVFMNKCRGLFQR